MFSKNLVIGLSRASLAQTGMLPKTRDVVSEHHCFLSESWPRSRILLVGGSVTLGLSGVSRLPASHSAVLFRARRDWGEIIEQSFVEISSLSLDNETSKSKLSEEKISLLSSLRKGSMSESNKGADDSSLFQINSKGDVPSNTEMSQSPPIIR